jgi:hypothetical protein
VTEIYGGIYTGFACSGKKVGDERKWVTVLLGDFVKPTEIDTEAEAAVLLLGE